jgi:hypothetical protein
VVSNSELWRDAAKGDTGCRLHERAEQAIRHWMQRAENLIAACDSDEFSYESAPPNRTFLVKTRYMFSGKGSPLPFNLDAG